MDSNNEYGNNSYILQALISFNEIMTASQLDVERLNRVNKGELFVLRLLAKRDDTALPSELSTALNSSTGRISALLGTLEKKGQIERNIDKSNRRNILVNITETGRERIEAELAKIRNNLTQIFTEMGESDTLEFIRLAECFFSISQKYMTKSEEDETSTLSNRLL
jgi:DNA-binding MarR family transcriptional regulator